MTLDDEPRSGRGAGRVAAADLRLLDLAVTKYGGVVRYLQGADYGLRSSIFRTEMPEGLGPALHRHPFVEIFVIEEGRGRYWLGDQTVEAEAGDIVIVPTGIAHRYLNIGLGPLRHTALLDGAERFVEVLVDEAGPG